MMVKTSDQIRFKIAIICFSLAYMALVLFGLRYIFARSFMSYHEVALGTKWDDLPESFHILYLASMKIVGGGILSVGIAGEILTLIPFRKYELWARWTLLVIGLIVGGMALTATLTIKFNTPASPPWILTSCCIILVLAGFFLSVNINQLKNKTS